MSNFLLIIKRTITILLVILTLLLYMVISVSSSTSVPSTTNTTSTTTSVTSSLATASNVPPPNSNPNAPITASIIAGVVTVIALLVNSILTINTTKKNQKIQRDNIAVQDANSQLSAAIATSISNINSLDKQKDRISASVSENRVSWISDLRKYISEYLTKLDEFQHSKKDHFKTKYDYPFNSAAHSPYFRTPDVL